MQVPNDSELQLWMGAVAARDRRAFDRLYAATLPRVLAYARRILMTEDAAEDCAAETYIQAWRDAAKYNSDRGPVMAWLFIICRSRAMDLLRERQRRGEISQALALELEEDAGNETENLIAQVDACSAVHPMLQQLPPEQRRLVGLAFFRDLSHSEIAAATGMPLGTVKSHIHRAISAMRQGLGIEAAEVQTPHVMKGVVNG